VNVARRDNRILCEH